MNSTNTSVDGMDAQLSTSCQLIIRETWKNIEKDISKVGVITFLGLFETHPSVQNMFTPFRGKSFEELKRNTNFRDHTLRVMSTIEKCVARIDRPTKLRELVEELGRRHAVLNIKLEYVDLVSHQMLIAFQSCLGDDWTLGVEDAWTEFLYNICKMMKNAMRLC